MILPVDDDGPWVVADGLEELIAALVLLDELDRVEVKK